MGIGKTLNKLRVANIIEEGKVGGPQIRILNVAKAMKAEIDTTVIMPNENSEPFQKLLDENDVSYKTFWMSRITKEVLIALRYFVFFPYEIARLAIYFHKEKFDIVHVSGGSWQYKGFLAAKLTGIKVIWHLNDTMMPLIFKVIFGLLSKYADSYIYASERTKSYYEKYCDKSKSSAVIPAPVDTIKFSQDYEIKLDRDFEQICHEKMVVGMVANINPVKGIDTFVKVARTFSESMPEVVFVVVGPTHKNQLEYFKSVKKINSMKPIGNVVFLDAREDVRPFLKRFDIYLCTSRAESSPLSVWEAMSMGKPIVSTNVGDVPLYVKHKINGFIAETEDYKSLGSYIAILLQKPSMRTAFGQNSREIAINELDISICSKRHIDAYLSV